LGAWLLEGRPEALALFCRVNAEVDSADLQCRKAFGDGAATVAWRLRRWTLEAVAAGR
jgi:hypothetical protein